MSYLLVTSRCPITHESTRGHRTVKENVGGVASALRRAMKQEGGTWICWGDGNLDHEYPEEDHEGYKIVRIFTSPRERKGFYEDYSNSTLWPLFHYFRGRIKNSTKGFSYYSQINERFAEAVAVNAKPDQIIWIHDYQLTLMPGMLRKKGVRNFIIFTWHIPWVASEFYSTLPGANEIMKGITASDMITFHTDLYRKNFKESYQSLGLEPESIDDKLFTFSLGIDTSYYETHKIYREPIELKHNRKLIFSIDRLDYTKGLANRAHAIESLMKRYPEDARKFSYVMVVTPSRSSVTEYIKMRKDLEMTVGRINGMHSDLSWQPILYMYRRITDAELMRYYKSADVALITPLIDGLNLVSKEFIAATTHGVLVLSRFAGAAESLEDALKVNPYDINEVADKIHLAMNMDEEEVAARVRGMKSSVNSRDLNWWLNAIKATAMSKINDMSEVIGTAEHN